MCAVTVDGRTLLATVGCDSETVRLWDPQTCNCLASVPTHHLVRGVTAIGDSLAISLQTGILVIKPNSVV
jgi:WD40 repeat protein